MIVQREHTYHLSYQIGVNLVVNAIRDAYLLVDGPNCVIFRTSQIQGNHDWLSDLLRSDGLHRVADTDCTTERAAVGDDRLLLERLTAIDAQPDCELVLLSAMSPVAVTGRQYDMILSGLGEKLHHPVILTPCGSLSGDWLHGYQTTLETLAEQLPLAPHGGDVNPQRVALVGYLFDRNEADHTANLAELGRLLAEIGLEVVSCWLDGGSTAALARIGEAATLVALPYGRRAAQVLAARTGAGVVDCDLPVGLDGTARWLRAIAAATGREAEAEALIQRELQTVVPRLEWVLPHSLANKGLAVVGDPHLAWALSTALDELGCRILLRTYWTDSSHVTPSELDGPGTVLVDPTPEELGLQLSREAEDGELDLVLTNSQALMWHARMRGGAIPFVELGFPSYYTHALFDRPYLGFRGTLCLVDRIVNSLSQACVRQKPGHSGQPT